MIVIKSQPGFAALIALVAFGCSSGGNKPFETTAETEEPVINGRVVTPFGPNPEPAFTRAILQGPGCTGTLVKPSWVLSAAHCAFAVGGTFVSKQPSGNVQRTINAVVVYPPSDAVMLHLDQPFTDLPTVPLYAGSGASVLGQNVSCYGYGYGDSAYPPNGNPCSAQNACPTGKQCLVNQGGWCVTPLTGKMTTGDFTATNTDGTWYAPYFFFTAKNALGQLIIHGDSGGPCTIGGTIAGLNAGLYFSHTGAGISNVGFLRDEIRTPSRVQVTVADFNADGRSDYIFTTASGSDWYLWTINGLTQVLSDSSLKLGSVMFTTGDFNGDGRTDLIQTTASDSTFLFATPTNGNFKVSGGRTDWVYGAVKFTTGNFDGNTKTDFVVSTPAGSFWHYDGDLNPQFTRTDLSVLSAKLTPGDFNRDGKTDLIVATMQGSQWLYANTAKTWNAVAADKTRADLPIDAVAYTPGDFDGDGRTDVIITTPSGSYWYFATSVQDQWSEAYTRFDLPLGSVAYTAGDYDGDGRDDLVIRTNSGSYWYYSTGRGTWDETSMPARGDLPLGNVMYTVVRDNSSAGRDLVITTESGSYWYDSTGKTFTEARVTGHAL